MTILTEVAVARNKDTEVVEEEKDMAMILMEADAQKAAMAVRKEADTIVRKYVNTFCRSLTKSKHRKSNH